jgi:hypothetical protein
MGYSKTQSTYNRNETELHYKKRQSAVLKSLELFVNLQYLQKRPYRINHNLM